MIQQISFTSCKDHSSLLFVLKTGALLIERPADIEEGEITYLSLSIVIYSTVQM